MDYNAKYENSASETAVVADLDPGKGTGKYRMRLSRSIRPWAAAAWRGWTFFLKESGRVVFNEINTLPGFTSISMYPKLWEASGIPYPDLIDKLLQLAME